MADPEPRQNEDLAFEQRVLRAFVLPNGSLRAFPAQQKKLIVVLRYCQQAFAAGQRYSEAETNAILARFHPDVAFLRRSMVIHGLLNRQGGGGDYWLPDASDPSQP